MAYCIFCEILFCPRLVVSLKSVNSNNRKNYNLIVLVWIFTCIKKFKERMRFQKLPSTCVSESQISYNIGFDSFDWEFDWLLWLQSLCGYYCTLGHMLPDGPCLKIRGSLPYVHFLGDGSLFVTYGFIRWDLCDFIWPFSWGRHFLLDSFPFQQDFVSHFIFFFVGLVDYF